MAEEAKKLAAYAAVDNHIQVRKLTGLQLTATTWIYELKKPYLANLWYACVIFLINAYASIPQRLELTLAG